MAVAPFGSTFVLSARTKLRRFVCIDGAPVIALECDWRLVSMQSQAKSSTGSTDGKWRPIQVGD